MLQVIKSLPPGFENHRMIDTLRKDFLPEGRLPTLEEMHRTFSNPMEADPRLVAYCYFRPEFVRVNNNVETLEQQCREGEEWK